MKKFYSLLFILFLACVSVSAKQISQNEALSVAKSFNFNKAITTFSSAQDFNTKPELANSVNEENLNLAYTATDGTHNFFYVYNRGNKGFIIVSADDCIQHKVLGYSNESNFDVNNIPSNMQWWLDSYKYQIKNAIEYCEANPLVAVSKPVQAVNLAPIATLMQTKWNQGAPYNNLCPYYKTGSRSATGCVATAMAQVMYYYKWPEKNLKNDRTYDWDNMKTRYIGSETEEQNTAVAQLMLDCGTSVNMDYGASSGAPVNNVPPALIEYFDYDQVCINEIRSVHSSSSWRNKVYEELAAKRPVLYYGYSTDVGHAFVCDGYDGDGQFHINWGWGGMSDGFFLLDDLNPYSQGIGGSSSDDGFNKMNSAIFYVKPNKNEGTSRIMHKLCGSGSFYYKQTKNNKVILDFKPGNFSVSSILASNGNKNFTGEINLVAYNKSNNQRTVIANYGTLSDFGVGYYFPDFDEKVALEETYYQNVLSAGTYDVRFEQKYNGQWIPLLMAPNNVDYVELTVNAAKQLTFKTVEPAKSKLTFSEVKYEPTIYLDGFFDITFDLKCENIDYEDNIYFIIRGTNRLMKPTYYKSAAQIINIDKDDTKTIKIVDKITTATWNTNSGVLGDCELVFVDENNKVLSSTYSIKVSNEPGNAQVEYAMNIKNKDNVVSTDFSADIDLTITDGYFLGNTYGLLYKEKNGDPYYYVVDFIDLYGAPGSHKFKFEGDYSAYFEQDITYTLYLCDIDTQQGLINKVLAQQEFTVTNKQSGIKDIDNNNANLIVYPNPATDVINIKNDNTIKEVKIYSIGGAEVLTKTVAGNNCSVNVENLPLGSYIVKIITDDDILVSRIIKK